MARCTADNDKRIQKIYDVFNFLLNTPILSTLNIFHILHAWPTVKLLMGVKLFMCSENMYKGAGYKTLIFVVYKTSLFSEGSKWLVIRPHLFAKCQVAVYKTFTFFEG